MRSRGLRIWRTVREVTSETAREAAADSVPMMAAAISYYLLVTIVPLVLALAVLAAAIRAAAGLPAADAATRLEAVLARYSSTTGGLIALTALGVVLLGASGVFSQFVLAVARIWKEPAHRGPALSFARRHLIAFVLLLVLAVGLVASLVVGSAVSAMTSQFAAIAASAGVDVGAVGAFVDAKVGYDFVAAFLLFTAAFTLIPARDISVRDVAPGAAVTAAAYALGQVGLTVYLTNSSRLDLYGSRFGGVIAVMLWAYYSSMIALYGAELTKAIVLRRERSRQTP